MLKKLRSKKVAFFGKQISATLLAMLALATLASAGLLSYYGMVTGTSTVTQAIVLTGTNCDNNECSTTGLEAAGSETAYSLESSIISQTTNDLDVKFSNSCELGGFPDDCSGITITNMVELSVDSFPSGTPDPFVSQYYKATNFEGPTSLAELNTVTYSFEITDNTFGVTNLAPYLVIVSDVFPYNAAVYLIPDEGIYESDTPYTKTIDGDSWFHIPGDNGCANQNPATATCSLNYIKTQYSGTITRLRLALGAWPGDGKSISALMGIGTINGEQAEHKTLPMYASSTVPTVQKYEFAPLVEAGVYDITTTVDAV